jgi:signal transduction histidine kinase
MEPTSVHEVISFKDFVNSRMSAYLVGIPLVTAISISLITAVIILIQFANSNQRFVESIAPHVAALLETQDRPEIQRFIRAVSTKQEAEIEVMYQEEIVASTLSLNRIGERIENDIKSLSFLNLKLNKGRLLSLANADRKNGWNENKAKIGIYLNTDSIFYVSIGVSIGAFILSFLVINWIIKRVVRESQKSLEHLGLLEKAIRRFQRSFETSEIPSFSISELESIRKAFIDTQNKLLESNDKIAKSKAKEMASYAYKNLIHDLHVPVTALRNHLKIMGLERATPKDRENALKRIVDLAEQVLKQVKSARSHLGLEISLKNDDLVESVRRATENAHMASFDKPKVEIRTTFPEFQIFKAHDPILLGRALSNLVTNAVEAAFSCVQVELLPYERGISIKVSDDGKGMDQEEVSLHLQGRGRSTKTERMGIGLASANHIVRSHGGRIIYQNSPLGGACFEVRLEGDLV